MSRWSPEQVEAIAPSPAALTAARPLTTVTRWAGLGADDRAVWGSCRGSGAEPYDTMVDHVGVASRCTCPSRRHPCKHVLALLLLWSHGDVPDTAAPARVANWVDARRLPDARTGSEDAPTDAGAGADPDAAAAAAAASSAGDSTPTPAVDPTPDGDVPELDRDRARDERVERMSAGLTELDRWLDDRMRTGLADPALAKYATWDELAARLVDAQAGSLANRIRRLAGLVGASPDWHGDVLAELGLLHLLAQAGRRLGSLPGPLADAVATTVGWQVRQADVLAGVPDTDTWIVAGRSDTREDRIEVRRHWLRGAATGRWALVLSFAAYRQSLDTSLTVGTAMAADLHRYPGSRPAGVGRDTSRRPHRLGPAARGGRGRGVRRDRWNAGERAVARPGALHRRCLDRGPGRLAVRSRRRWWHPAVDRRWALPRDAARRGRW
jgi:hypothetical protein